MTKEEAIEVYNGLINPKIKEAFEFFVPELRENEDERIIQFFAELATDACGGPGQEYYKELGLNYDKVMAWLEKQKDIWKEKAQNITANMLEDKIEGIQRELIEFLSNTVDASWVDIIQSADAYAERIRNIIEKQKEQNSAWSEEDEKIRKALIHIVKGACSKYGIKYRGDDITEEMILSYLEKQKAKERLDRMAPIYNDKESFESALEKAWKYYNESASRTVDSFEDDYIECVFSKGFREGFLYREKQKESLHIQKTCKENADSFTDEDERIRRRIIGYLKQDIEEYPERKERIDEMLAYLERQKEQEHICDSAQYEEGFKTGLEIGLRKQKEQKEITIEHVYKEFITSEKLKDAKTNKYIRAQLLWELMHNGIITEDDYQYLTDNDDFPYSDQKKQKPILEVFGFKIGDAVRLKDGDGRKHIIKSFEEIEGIHGPNFYHVEFEDNSASDGIYPGEEYPNGYYTHMEKFEE